MSRRHRHAELAYTITARSDRAPRVGDLIQLGKQAYEVALVYVRVELLPVRDEADGSEETDE